MRVSVAGQGRATPGQGPGQRHLARPQRGGGGKAQGMVRREASGSEPSPPPPPTPSRRPKAARRSRYRRPTLREDGV